MTDMDKYRVTLTAEERADLEQLISTGKAAARKLTHARILLLADDSLGEERPDDQIVAALGISLRTVSRVRRHLVTDGVDVALLRRRGVQAAVRRGAAGETAASGPSRPGGLRVRA